MFGSINPAAICEAHIRTFQSYHTRGGMRPWLILDIVFVFMGPLVLSLGATLAGVRLNEAIANILITSLSIFAGLLFNLLVLAHTLREKLDRADKVRARVL